MFCWFVQQVEPPVLISMCMQLVWWATHYFNTSTWNRVWSFSPRTSNRPGLDQTRTAKNWTAVLVFQILNSKTRTRLVHMNWFKLILTSLLQLHNSNCHENESKIKQIWMKIEWDMTKTTYKQISTQFWSYLFNFHPICFIVCSFPSYRW